METTIRIHTDQLTAEIIDGIKKLFPHRTIQITVQPADETENILSSPSYAAELKSRIEEYKVKNEGIRLKTDDLV